MKLTPVIGLLQLGLFFSFMLLRVEAPSQAMWEFPWKTVLKHNAVCSIKWIRCKNVNEGLNTQN